MKFNMYDVVRLKEAKGGLPAGARGTVVMAYQYPREGYDVEFPELRETVPVLTLYPDDLEPKTENG